MNTDYLDSYCERAMQTSMLAEPINALTNAAFIIAAMLAMRSASRANALNSRHIDIILLCFILGCIGIGSFAWHVQPSSLTVMMDVIPISAFINIYLIACLRRVFGFPWLLIGLFVAVLQLMNAVAPMVFSLNTLHGTILYLPTYGMLWIVIALAATRQPDYVRPFINVTLLWTVSLIARTIDVPVCNVVPFGTHFLWHLLNALVLYKLILILVSTTAQPDSNVDDVEP